MASRVPQTSLGTGAGGGRLESAPWIGSGSNGVYLTPESDSDDDSYSFIATSSDDVELQQRGGEKIHVRELEEDDEVEDDTPFPKRRGSASTTQSFMLYTPDEERAVIKKFDWRLVSFVSLLYMLSFLDRSSEFTDATLRGHTLISPLDIGNARIAGLETDLSLTPGQYEWVLTSFYIAYILFEWMSLLWRIIPAHIYVSLIVLSWGITASLQSCASSFTSLIVLRLLLGIGEAGFTGIPYYLSFFYKKEELALRTGFFISAAPLATSFASSLAWAILKLGEGGPIAPWRLLFLVEGFPSVIVAIVAWHIIPDGPAKASYLTSRERKVARLRLRRRLGEGAKSTGGLKWREVLHTISDPKAYLTAVMFFFSNMAYSSMPVFLPTIIKSMGHSALTSQALSAPPYLMAFVVVIATAYLSDKYRSRSSFIIFHALLSACGYFILALSHHYNIGIWYRYAAIYPACIGFFSVITLIITWTINNQESESRQGAGFVMMQLIGQCGPLVGTRLYPEEDAPWYGHGMAACTGAMVMVAMLALVLRSVLARKNRMSDKGKMASVEYEMVGKSEQEEGFVPRRTRDAGKSFVYML